MWRSSGKNRPSQNAGGPSASSGAAVSAAEASVRQLIANGKHKAAVQAAKEHHKAQGTRASETLLVEAYAARIRSLADQNLEAEAKALRELVCERYPSAREKLDGGNGRGAARAGGLDELVRPLNDPELSAERRTAIEAALQREVADPAALAECAALPADHPLREAAAAVRRAFTAVTSGAASGEAVELPEVSRRSPLAPWKSLVRAIACYYRGEEAACRRYLDAIQPESAPARLIPAMQALAGGKPERLTPAASALVSSIASHPAALRKALEELDRAFDSSKRGGIFQAIRQAVQACRTSAPDQLERLRQHVSVRGLLAELNGDKLLAAMGGAARHDAYFSRLLARGMEQTGGYENQATACAVWEEFRQQAVREGWFAANSPEAATLYLHMAGVLQELPPKLLGKLQTMASQRYKKPDEDLYFLHPEKLYERVCSLDPHLEAFAQWMEWAKRSAPGKVEDVAEAWHKIRPDDIEPILHLMEAKERRKAFHTALQYLARAERIDSVHPTVRRARLRMLAGSALRHLQQNKPHLARGKLEEMTALPQSRQGDRPAFLAALGYMVCTAGGESGEAAAHRAELERLLGCKAAAALLISGVAGAARQGEVERLPPAEALGKAERAALPEAIARVIELAKDLELRQPIPEDWLAEAARQFQRNKPALEAGQLQTLAEVGLSAGHLELAYAISGAGLERCGAAEAGFLLLRALALPDYLEERRAVCASAAAQLARQQRNMSVVEKAVEISADAGFEDLSLTAEQVSQVLRKEKAESSFPTAYRPGPDYREILRKSDCNCPECRRGRGEAVDSFDKGEEDFDDLDVEEMLKSVPLPPGMPPGLAKILIAEIGRALVAGESVDSLMDRLFGPAGPGGKRKKGRRG